MLSIEKVEMSLIQIPHTLIGAHYLYLLRDT